MRNLFNRYSELESINEDRRRAFDKLKGFSKDNSIVTLNTLRSLKVGEWHYTEDNQVKYKLISLDESEAVFITVMEKNSTFSIHEHDCIERGIVVEGHLIDDLNHLKLKKDEEWIYNKNQKHKPYCRVRSVYEVTFAEN